MSPRKNPKKGKAKHRDPGDLGEVYEFKSISRGTALAKVRPAGERDVVWRKRTPTGRTQDFKLEAFSSIEEFERAFRRGQL